MASKFLQPAETRAGVLKGQCWNVAGDAVEAGTFAGKGGEQGWVVMPVVGVEGDLSRAACSTLSWRVGFGGEVSFLGTVLGATVFPHPMRDQWGL